MTLMRLVECPKCLGAGQLLVPDWAGMRKRRLRAGVSLREMAKRLKITAPYLSDIERGRRNCPPAIVQAYDLL